MPTYDYECKECKTMFSMVGSYSTLFNCNPICPCCRSENVKKKIGDISIIYKGKGFYTTDKNKENKKENRDNVEI